MRTSVVPSLLMLLSFLSAVTGCDDQQVLRRRLKALGGTIRQVTFGGGAQPDWSADSNRIAYIHGNQVWSIKPDGGDERQLTDLPDRAYLPRWRPGGNDLAFVYEEWDGKTGIRLLSGGEVAEILGDVRPIAGLTWSAGGERLFFVREQSADGVEYISSDGSGYGVVPNRIGWGKVLSVAAFYTGADLLYVELRNGVYNLWRIPQAGGEPVQLTDYRADDPVGSIMSQAAPSRDGSRVALLTSQEHPYRDLMLHSMPVSGGDMAQLIELSVGDPGYPVWSPDDREIALELTGYMTEVWVLELK